MFSIFEKSQNIDHSALKDEFALVAEQPDR